MSYSTSGLVAYVEQQNYPLIHKSLLGAKTPTIVKKQTGVKGQATINILDEDATFQAGACGFTPTGSSTLSQRTITTGFISVQKRWCPTDLEGLYAQTQLAAGSYPNSIPFEETFMDDQTGYINQEIEKALWFADKGLSSPVNYTFFDGFAKVISGSGGFVTGSFKVSASGTTPITASNVLSILDGVYTAIPPQILDKPDVVILVGMDTYRTFTVGLKNANLFNYAVDATSNYEMILPGTTIKVIGLNGLNQANNSGVGTATLAWGAGQPLIFAGRLSNFYMGVDLESDADEFKLWYSQDNDEVRMKAKFRLGAQVAFPGEIVVWGNGQ